MITYKKGNILDSKAYYLVNTVNIVGVMGKGIALLFKNNFSYNFKLYKEACSKDELKIGELFIVKDYNSKMGERMIINFPTKTHWKYPSRYSFIKNGVIKLQEYIIENKVKKIAIPALGCGNGGLDWDLVKIMIEDYLAMLDCEIEVYEPMN